jgi:transcriptional regulator with XRE-family HTH domain
MSQETLGFKSGFDRSYIGALEAGWRNPSLETICRLAKALRVDAADLVEGTQAKRGRPGRR